MNTIMGLNQLLLMDDKYDKELIYDDVKGINEASKALLSLINNIDDYSNLVSSKDDVEESEYNLNEFLFDLNDTIKNKITKEDLKYEFALGGNLPKMLYGDFQKIQKILLNIIGNIIRNADKGMIMLTVNCNSKTEDMCVLEFVISTTGIHMNHVSYSNSSENEEVNYEDLMSSDTLGTMVVQNLVDELNANLKSTGEAGQENGYVLSLKQKIVDENAKKPEEKKVEEKEETPKEEQEGGVSNA